MKEVGAITRVTPDRRVEALLKFRKRLADNAEVKSTYFKFKVVDYISF